MKGFINMSNAYPTGEIPIVKIHLLTVTILTIGETPPGMLTFVLNEDH